MLREYEKAKKAAAAYGQNADIDQPFGVGENVS